MDSITSLVSPHLLQDVLEELKKGSQDTMLVKKSTKNADDYVYYDPKFRSYGAHSFILFRNAFDSYASIQEEMISTCWSLEVDKAVSHYAVELFDQFYGRLIEKSMKEGVLKALPFAMNLNSNFGLHISQLDSLNMHFGSLYFQVGPGSCYKFCSYGRTICMAMCVFIASKQFVSPHLKMSKVRGFLTSKAVPTELITRKELLAIEGNILNVCKFELSITTVKDYLEALLFGLLKDMRRLHGRTFEGYFSPENTATILKVCLTLIENYYLLQLPFLYKLFRTFRKRPFNIYSLEDIEELENLNRDKLFIASIILGAACSLVNPHYNSSSIFSHIAWMISTENECIHLGCQAIYSVLLHRLSKCKNTLTSY